MKNYIITFIKPADKAVYEANMYDYEDEEPSYFIMSACLPYGNPLGDSLVNKTPLTFTEFKANTCKLIMDSNIETMCELVLSLEKVTCNLIEDTDYLVYCLFE